MIKFHLRGTIPAILLASLLAATGSAAATRITPFTQSVAEAASEDEDLRAFYRGNGYEPLWVGDDADDRARRGALLRAIELAPMHGLPGNRYDAGRIRALMASARSGRDLGEVEVALSELFLRFAADLGTGILTPGEVVPAIKRVVPLRDRLDLLRAFETAAPESFLAGLTPRSQEYTRLVREKLVLEQTIERGGWGAPILGGKLEPGATGPDVIALRDRLIAMGYLRRTASRDFDAAMRAAVETFQADQGLAQDGIVGGDTLTELNRAPEYRLGAVLVAMERERWLDRDLGQRHVWVNLTDFKARIVDHGEVVFETRSVIGKHEADRETPEFSDTMDHMVINPSWYVPRSIVVKEYLPVLRRNPYALGHLEITDRNGRPVNRGRGFSQYSDRTFPFAMRQPPSTRNALGLVKFMFPNKYNIYLHDTPAKNLFSRDMRAFSHGCIRLNDPFDFAYALLSVQSDDPEGLFRGLLETGRESRLNLDEPLPVHLVYRTAITKPEGGMQYRRDVYGRDAAILAALGRAGVDVPAVGS